MDGYRIEGETESAETLVLRDRKDKMSMAIVRRMNKKMNNLKADGAGDPRSVNLELDKFRFLVNCISFLAILGMFICGIDQELFIVHGKNVHTDVRVYLLSFN